MSKLKFWWAALFVGISTGATAQEPLEDTQTAVSGTEDADVIDVTTDLDATASISTSEGGELSATATGVDALQGDDTIGGTAAITTGATTTAAVLNATEASEGSATAVGVNAGDGDDQVSGGLDIAATATATGLFAGDISYTAAQPPPKEIEISVKTEASATGIDSGGGEDQVSNDGSFVLTADATSGGSASQFSATVQESVSIKAESEASASTTGISSGGDSDLVTNDSIMTNDATATSAALAVELLAPSDQGAPAGEQESSIKSEANSTASASSTGINSADDSTEESSEQALPWELGGLRVTKDESKTTEGSNDVVENNAALNNTAVATSGAGSGGVSNKVDGSMEASATSEATAESTGISTGVGSDRVTNGGALVSHATANAGALSVSIEVGTPSQSAPSPPPGELPEPATPSEDKENKSSSNTNVTAEATASGISTEGSGSESVTAQFAEISDGQLVVDFQQTTNTVAGNDMVENHGDIEAVADANAGSLSAGVTQSSGGSSSSQSNSTAKTSASGITTGGGNDNVTSDGILTVSANSEASALNVGLAVGMPADNSGGEQPADTESDKVTTESSTTVEAEAGAVGIQTSGESSSEASKHLVLNSGGLSLELSESSIAAIDDDTVINDNLMTVSSVSSAGAADAGIALNAVGSVSSDASTTSTSSTLGIATGAGSDTITNNFLLTASSIASADALSVGITASKPTTGSGEEPDKTNVKVKAGATSEASSIGIDAEGSGHDSSKETTLSITANGLHYSQTTSDVSQAGADRVTNAGGMDIDATATSGTLAAGFSIGAAGSVDADATSRSDAVSGGISTGGGADIIDNTGVITSDATATSNSLALSLSVSQPEQGSGGQPPTAEELEGEAAVMKGGSNAEATARATGIDAEGTTHSSETEDTVDIGADGLHAVRRVTTGSTGGNDQVTNDAGVTATATASTLTGAIGLGIQSEGTASAEANATARASSGALLTGAGSDIVDNRDQGTLVATATSSAGALSVSFSMTNEQGAKASSNARATSDSQAVGIGTGSEEVSRERVTDLTIDSSGIALTYRDEQLADDGADTVTNAAGVTVTANATSGAIGAAIAIDGSASTDVTATSRARAHAIDIGAGNDTLTNEGTLSAMAESTSGALGIAFGREGGQVKTQGEVKVEVNALADAEATGIRGDSGANSLTDASLIIDGSGVEAHLDWTSEAAGGNDTIVNLAAINAEADAFGGAAGGSVAIDGAAKVEADATARTRATAIDGGGGNDSVRNEGAVTADADSQAYTIALSVGANTAQGTASSKVDASSTATASSAGISTDGAARTGDLAADLTIGSAGLNLALAANSAAASGDDTLTNLDTVVSRANADSGVAAIAVTVKGAANSAANSTATATSAALDSGGGADSVTNDSRLESTATARAMTLSAAISTEGRAISNSGFMGAGTKADARSSGITTRGMEETQSVEATADISFNDIGVSATFAFITDAIGADGVDSVTNSGEIVASSTATAPRLNIAGTGKGIAVSMGRVESESHVTGIDTGHLDDAIDNSGQITATSLSTATLANISVSGKGLAIAANAVWDGGTEATASAAGIDADGGERKTIGIEAEADEDLARVVYTKEVEAASGDDSIVNSATVRAEATAEADSLNLAVVAQTGLAAAVSTSTANADAFGLRGGDGDDAITNSGHLISIADATARTANVSVTNEGASIAADAVWDGGTEATARSIGIAGDGGDRTRTNTISVGTDHTGRDKTSELADGIDTISNTFAVDSTATAEALSLSVAATGRGVSAATATSTATAMASAIDAGQGTSVDNVNNTGALNATSSASATSASISVTNQGLAVAADAVWDGGTKAIARSRGIDVGSGGETIANSGNIGASADAETIAVSAAVSIRGVAAATATSTSTADAAAIDAGAGSDTDNVTNGGTLTVNAESDAVTAIISVTNDGVSIAADAVWDGGTTSNARARGIDVGSAADVVDNTGDMTVTSDAATVALSASITVNGGAAAVSTSTVNSSAAGIDAGDEDVRDVVTNSGDITATANGTAVTATLSFAMNGVAVASDAAWNGGTHSNTWSRGISTGNGSDEIRTNGTVRAEAEALGVSVAAGIAVNGVAGAIATSTSDSTATALDAGDGVGDDFVQNAGELFADSTANSAAVAVSFTANGVAVAGADVWDGGVESHSAARGVSVGAGTDRVENTADIESRSSATATGVSVAVSVQGVAGAITTATAMSDAYGIDGAAGDDILTNGMSILADADSNANSISVAGTMYGVSAAGNNAWDGGVTSTARSSAISGGSGLDTIVNLGALTSNADSLSPSVSVSFTVAGVAAAVSTATSNADARAIDGGDDADDITNGAALVANATSDAVSVNVSLTGAGVAVAADSVWDGGTTANAAAYGISGGAGDDDVSTISTLGTVSASSHATTTSVAVSISGGGFAGSTSTSTANSSAAAIDGGAGHDLIYSEATTTARAEADATSVSVSVTGAGGAAAVDSFWDGGTKANSTAAALSGGDGDDNIRNAGAANVIADSETLSATVAASFSPNFGLALATSASTATADALAIRGDAGDDLLDNFGAVLARSDAYADGIEVAFTTGGVAATGVFDASTRGFSSATGLSGGDGTDTLRNNLDGSITLDAGSEVRELAAAVTLAGVAQADASAQAFTRGFGLDGGAGNDSLTNVGTISGTVAADADTLSVSAVAIGAGLATANSRAQSSGAALAGGLGDDDLVNQGSVNLDFSADARGLAISFSAVGGALSQANAESVIDAHGLHGDAGADELVNTGSLIIDASAEVDALSVSVAGIGGSNASANSVANSATTGMSGGADADVLINDEDATVDVHAGALLTSNAVSVSITGASVGEARTAAQVGGTGLSGGEGDDGIDNRGAVVVTTAARSNASGFSFNLTGATTSRAGTEADSLAIGIDGGAGDDIVLNSGSINVGPTAPGAWMAHLTADAQGVGIMSGADAQSATLARTQASGINGGEGADQMQNTGSIAVRSNAFTEATSGTINVFGSADGGGKSGAFTTATGMDGAAGNDLLLSLTSLTVNAESRLSRNGTSFSFAGGGAVDTELVAETTALGLGGGAGDDEIGAAGDIVVSATSTLTSSGGGTTVFGSSSSAGKSGAVTQTNGIDGGAGADVIDNQADITLTALSNLTLNQSSYTFGGSDSSSGTLAAITGGEAITGGSGADSIANSGMLTLDIRSTLTSTGNSSTTFGGSGDFVTSGGVTTALGIAGGDDDDVLENFAQGFIDITASTNVNTQSMSYVFAGTGPSTGSVLTGEVTAAGMSGDAGNDIVINRGTVHVDVDAALTSRGGASNSFTATSDPDSTGTATVVADAVGLAGGAGDDDIANFGDLIVNARGDADAGNDAGTGAASVVNGNTAGSVTRSTVNATGIDGGAGVNRVEIDGAVTVDSMAISYSLTTSSGANVSFQSDGESVANSDARATAVGVAGLAGDDSVLNLDDISVTATATTSKTPTFSFFIYTDIRGGDQNSNLEPPERIDEDDLPPVADYATGEVVYWENSPDGEKDPNNAGGDDGAHYQVQVVTVDPDGPGGDPPQDVRQWVWLEDGLYVRTEVTIDLPSFPSYAASNGGGFNGEGFSYATGFATATAKGMSLDGGNNVIENHGNLTVQATADATMYASADGDGVGDSFSSATATASALAVGIEVGDGNDDIYNSGVISVTARPTSQVRAQSSTDEICIWFFGWWCGSPGDSEGDTFAHVNSTALGVIAGNGNNRFVNDGELIVSAGPGIRNDPNFGQFIASIDAEEDDTMQVTANSTALGISTGTGNDEIVNNGDITVTATGYNSNCSLVGCIGLPANAATVSASGILTGGGDDEITNAGSIVVTAQDIGVACVGEPCFSMPTPQPRIMSATGVITGTGNDIFRNLGTLRAEVILNGARFTMPALDMGEGDDQLFLGNGSSIVGTVTLGEGNDTLDLRGTPSISNSAAAALNVDAGNGIDTLVLNGLGSYAGSPLSIERAIKRETGTYTLGSLPTLQHIGIEDGTLRVNADYAFAADGTFETFFNVNGDSGVLSLAGDVTLGGGISVERRGDTFVANGRRFNVVHADGAVTGDFTDIALPEARPLLSFTLEREAQDVDVVAVVPSFSSVTSNPLYTQIAVNLDGIAPGSSGDLAELFGGLQNLGSDFDRALASFSPDTHLATSGSVLTNLREMTRVLQGHLSDSRVRYRFAPHARMPEASMSFSGGSGGLGMMQLVPDRRMAGMADLPAPPPAEPKASKGPRAQAWMLGIGAQGDYRSIEGYSAFDTDTQGFMFGADRKGDNWLVGVTLGQAKTDIASGEFATGEIDTWLASAYATWFDDNLYFETGLTIGNQDFEDRRLLNVAADLRTASSKHDGKAWSAFMAGGMSMDYGGFAVEPYLSLNYFEASEDGFEETGADSISQVIGRRDGNAFLGEAGANFSFRHDWARGLIDWHASLAVSHDFGVDSDPLTYSYVGVPDALFSIDGRPVDESATLWGLGVSFMGDQSALALDYRGLQDSYREEKFFSARMSLRF